MMKIEPGFWNCCQANPAKAVAFDDDRDEAPKGALVWHFACPGCASTVHPSRVMPMTEGAMPNDAMLKAAELEVIAKRAAWSKGITVEMVSASDYEREHYGITFKSARAFKIKGQGVYNRHFGHRVTVWDNTVRPDGAGRAGYIDPDGRPTDDKLTIIVRAEPMVLAAGNKVEYSAIEPSIGDHVRLLYPDGITSALYILTARPTADPILTLAPSRP